MLELHCWKWQHVCEWLCYTEEEAECYYFTILVYYIVIIQGAGGPLCGMVRKQSGFLGETKQVQNYLSLEEVELVEGYKYLRIHSKKKIKYQ